jgi:alkylation response protein AidB-like acyl-CoA dehydrogenase
MDFASVILTEDQQAFAGQVRAFLDEHLTAEVYARRRERAYNFDEGLYLALGSKGWLWPRWRREDGGAGLDDVCARLLETELDRREAPLLSGTPLIWPGVEAHADPELRAELKPQVARGTVRLCMGYTEPDGGSDIAGAKTRAVRDGDEWIINGQKIFTTGAQYCQYVFLITRTDPALPKHKGLTMFLVPLSSAGIEIQALHTIGEERTNIVYYSDVRVPDRYRIGEVNNGWSVLHGPLDAEHYIGDTASKLDDVSPSGQLAHYFERSVEAAVRWAQATPAAGGTLAGDQAFLARIGHMLAELEAGTCTPGTMGRVKGSDVARLGCEELIDLVGPAATLPYGTDGAISDGVIEFAHREAQHTATPGGTVEVFRTIIAQHDLGLPRPDYPGRKVFLQQGRAAMESA